jgi:hypothetical protein
MGQLPYWIEYDGCRAGVVLFALPRLSRPLLGISPMQLLELARLWLHPDVQELRVAGSDGREHAACVGSCAVARAVRRAPGDWAAKYPRLPSVRAVVGWSDDEHHEGVLYRAAGFQAVKKSGGALHGTARRRNGGRDQAHADYLHEKTLWFRLLPDVRVPKPDFLR